jgi:hypothetical protein
VYDEHGDPGPAGPRTTDPATAPKPIPPGAAALAAQVALAREECEECEAATATEAALLDERQALKAQQKALEQDRRALSQQRLPPRTLDRREAELLDRRQELEEKDFGLTQRQHSARLRAGAAAAALKQAQHRLTRARV